MEDGETGKRKNRNAVRKKAARGEASRRQKCHPTETCTSFLGWWANGSDTALAYRMSGRGPLKAADFGNSDAVWPPRTPGGHQHWGWHITGLSGGKDGGCGLISSHQRATEHPEGLQLPSSALQNAPVVPGAKTLPTRGVQDTFYCKCRILKRSFGTVPQSALSSHSQQQSSASLLP